MKIKTILVISALSSLSAMSEEVHDDSDVKAGCFISKQTPMTESADNKPQIRKNNVSFFDSSGVSKQIRLTDVAGVGEFVNPPTPETVPMIIGDFPLKIRVSEYWTGDQGTNIITIPVSPGSGFAYGRAALSKHVPIVFFAVKKDPDSERKPVENGKTNDVANVSSLVFYPRNTAWFEQNRDNGVVYTYVTNLWNCVRVNPDKEKYYETIRNGDNFSSKKSMWVGHDALFALLEFVQNADEEWLAKMYADPELPQHSKRHVESLLRQKYDWHGTNDMIQPPPMTTEND